MVLLCAMIQLVLEVAPAGFVTASRLGLDGRLDLHLAQRWRRHAKQALAIGLSHGDQNWWLIRGVLRY